MRWLLDESRPNLQWRVLIELVGRPGDSLAVGRARGGASAVDPVATLLADLLPDGSWATSVPVWRRYSGPAWRWIAAVAWGADPFDPRLLAAAELLLETAAGEGGVATRDGSRPCAVTTARLVQAMAAIGLARHLRVQEALAWFEEDSAAWSGRARDRFVAAVALLAGLSAAGRPRRDRLVTRAVEEVLTSPVLRSRAGHAYRHPSLARSDVSEALWSLARMEIRFESRMRNPLERLQTAQLPGGRWPALRPLPASLPVDSATRAAAGHASQWITLRAVVAMNAYAVPAGLPRMFPHRPA